MSLSNIYVNDTKAQFKDISCNTLSCETLDVAGGSGVPVEWIPAISNVVNLSGAYAIEYSRYSKVGNVVSANIVVSGLSILASDTQSSFIFTLPENAYADATEVKVIGFGRVFEYPESNTTVVNSGATPDRCTLNFKSATGSIGASVYIMAQIEYVVA